MKLWRQMLISFSFHIFKEGLTNVRELRNVCWHMIQSLLKSMWVFFLVLFFFFHRWIRPLKKSSLSVSKFQGNTHPCFGLNNLLAAWCCFFKGEQLLCDLELYQLQFSAATPQSTVCLRLQLLQACWLVLFRQKISVCVRAGDATQDAAIRLLRSSL